MLVSAVKQNQSALSIHISPPFWISLPPLLSFTALSVITEQQAELCVIQQLPASYLFHTWSCVCVKAILSSSHLPLCLPCPQVCSLHSCLYSCPANRFVCTIFSGFCIHVLIYDICFSLSDFSLYDRLRFIHISTNDPVSFLFMANIPLCNRRTTSSLSIHLSSDIHVVSMSWPL